MVVKEGIKPTLRSFHAKLSVPEKEPKK